ARSQISTFGSYVGFHRHPDYAYPRQWRGHLGHRTRRRSIEEERRMQVLVRDNNVDQALKVLKRKMQREGVFREMKLRGHYEKPSEPPRPQARSQKAAARGSAADEASDDPGGPRKRRPRAHSSLLILEQPYNKQSRYGGKGRKRWRNPTRP